MIVFYQGKDGDIYFQLVHGVPIPRFMALYEQDK
jgi:hypothetical protein